MAEEANKVDAAAADDKKADAPKVGDVVEKPQGEVVSLSAFLELKKDNKALRDSIKSMEDQIAAGASKKELGDIIKTLVDDHGLDESVAKTLAEKAAAEVDKVAEKKVQPLKEKLTEREQKDREREQVDEQARIDKAFQAEFAKTLDRMPEFKDIANAEVIKQLSLLRDANGKLIHGDKSFDELIEETYGKAITGRKTIDDTTAGGGKEPDTLDYARAKKDTAYFEEIMKNPELKKAYNERMLREAR